MNKDLELILRSISSELAITGNVHTEALENLDVALNAELCRRQDLESLEVLEEVAPLGTSEDPDNLEIIYDGPFMEFKFPTNEESE